MFLCFLTFSCSDNFKKNMPNVATSQIQDVISRANPDFQQGWNDGCEVGTSAGGNTFMKTIFKSNKVNGYKITESNDYKGGWNFAFWYCYRYQYVKNKSWIWNSMFGGYK